ncbi:glycoside hydrolase family 25 protein [Apibacter muscae]|nr:GH25 family lysozyme [Apibacter muscae]TWP30965.1 glycoside hydrolase family 25 protein [Apibacter muscae]
MKKRRINRKKKKKSNNIYYWLTALIIIISLALLSKFMIKIYNDFLKDSNNNHNLLNSRKISEEKKINSILKEYQNCLFGIDISKHQGKINWDSIHSINSNYPITFVFVRATQGIYKKDNFFDSNWNNLKAKKFIKGAYHYYNPDQNSSEQAKNFIKAVHLEKGDLPPVLDIEELPKNQSIDLLKKGIMNWLRLVENEYKIKPIIYSNDAYFIHHIKDLDLENYPIWVANYNPIKYPLHTRWSFWQFSEKGIIPGITYNFVDLNVFNGDINKLNTLRVK